MKTAPFRVLALCCFWLAIGAGSTVLAQERAAGNSHLAGATVLIIRHADKPDDGDGLSPAGIARANTYVKYFENYRVDDSPIKLTALFAAADSKKSHRPLLTLEPLSRAIGLPIDSRFNDKDYEGLAKALASSDHGRGILICWHHGEIDNLLRALGADPGSLLPGGKWPASEYGWVIELHFDQDAHLAASKRVVEGF
jgi:hypothetical protein